jgi:hypothetical protein
MTYEGLTKGEHHGRKENGVLSPNLFEKRRRFAGRRRDRLRVGQCLVADKIISGCTAGSALAVA